MSRTFFARYYDLYNQLKLIIKSSEGRVINGDIDELFSDNTNFFVKSYLISICTYLEAFLQDIAFEHANFINNRLKHANVPHNYIYWRLFKDEVKAKDLAFKDIDFSINKKTDIADKISANPDKTIRLFKYLGIDLVNYPTFNEKKDIISAIVNKRNSIIHHNDNATDISFSDLICHIDVILEYIKFIDDIVLSERDRL